MIVQSMQMKTVAFIVTAKLGFLELFSDRGLETHTYDDLVTSNTRSLRNNMKIVELRRN